MQETGLYEYKIHGAMDDMDPELCAQVYVDWEYRKKWDSYAIGEYVRVGIYLVKVVNGSAHASHNLCIIDLHPIKDESTGVEGLYWCVDYPWPMSDRDVSLP